MLKTLTLTNFALIENACIEFERGLNVLTGETGAGKSILIDAFSSVLGSRSSTGYIRTGCDCYRVEGVFDITDLPEVIELFTKLDIPYDEDGTVIIHRRLTQHSKNTILVNGMNVTLSLLKTIGAVLVDIHGQHDNQALLRPESYLQLLDVSASSLQDELIYYQNDYRLWADTAKQLQQSQTDERERAQRLDLLRWQIQEIDDSKLQLGEEEKLENELRVVSNAEKISEALQQAYTLLNDEEKNGTGILALMHILKHEIELIGRYEPKFKAAIKEISDSVFAMEEISHDVRNYIDTYNFNPNRLRILQERMDIIYRLKKKYGSNIEDVLAYYQAGLTEIDELTTYDERLEKLQATYDQLSQMVKNRAEILSELRCQTAKELSENILQHIKDLGMARARFNILVEPINNFSLTGKDKVSFAFSANAGEDEKPLQKVASGGELSRIALAIKTVASQKDAIPTMVFDEVDAGVGGKTAQVVAEKIAFVAKDKQVLCITHLAQIACMADVHIFIEKKDDEARTSTEIRILNDEERVREITRMVSGDIVTDIGLNNAVQMIDIARQKKDFWKKQA